MTANPFLSCKENKGLNLTKNKCVLACVCVWSLVSCCLAVIQSLSSRWIRLLFQSWKASIHPPPSALSADSKLPMCGSHQPYVPGLAETHACAPRRTKLSRLRQWGRTERRNTQNAVDSKVCGSQLVAPAHFMCLGVFNREHCTQIPQLLGFFKRGSCSRSSDSCTVM